MTTTLTTLTERLSMSLGISLDSARDRLITQIIIHDFVNGTVTDPMAIETSLGYRLISMADASHELEGALALGERRTVRGITVAPPPDPPIYIER
ncbi:MAG TPA: hypothetical protein H9870_07365 [Candidatus Corynebacterium avicola]|uniref:Uncharacterized protein n=1 Tax=Candidatus Corynebacterium avicola TaxID=2838527 RepID=A0A9D1RN67_9CORY|nr:hypothetical protein [Candidatus Corynebacterium avicola]